MKIAILGAAGKMGTRISNRLRGAAEYELTFVEAGAAGEMALLMRGDQHTPMEEAVADADVVVLALPDVAIGGVAAEVVPQMRSGAMVMCLDPAAPYAGKLPDRSDVTYFVTHPAHPPIFNDEEGEARDDHFGSGLAKQAIVNALMQGPEEDYVKGEEIARRMFGPILRSHRVTVEQMAMLEPTLSETVALTCVAVLREAMDEAVCRGVPEAAARDFLLGHIHVELAIYFDQIDWDISDGAKKVLEVAKSQIFQPDWKKVFEPESVLRSVRQIVGDIPLES